MVLWPGVVVLIVPGGGLVVLRDGDVGHKVSGIGVVAL